MTVLRMDHVGVIVDDMDNAIEFFKALGLEADNEMELGGELVDRIIGLDGARSKVAFVRTPDGHNQIELIQFLSPPYEGSADPAAEPSHAPGIRHLTFAVDDLDATLERLYAWGATLVGTVETYGTSYKLCYLRGPAGIIVEVAEKLS